MAVDTARLKETIARICRSGCGILAADESMGTIAKRFASINIESTPENRRNYRNMLFSTPKLEEHMSGVILFDETVNQMGDSGMTFPRLLDARGIVPGIKVDTGKVDHPNFAPESLTRGLDGLEKRLAEYTERSGGTLRFTKWRQVIEIGPGIPNRELIESALDAMAQYAAISQHAGYVPITEPEVLMDGEHGIERCGEVTELTLTILYQALRRHRIEIPLTLLKPNMVIAGKKAGKADTPDEVAEATLRVFQKTVPAEVPGIVFLSGGQSAVQATENLNAIGKRAATMPWLLSFSYGRALQDPALKAWNGENVPAGQAALALRSHANGLAQMGRYERSMEST